MARAAYLAPGVYVEEVPSAQQPIAGVGTNTVGFIGVVPDEIQCPVPNDDYDPTLALAAAAPPADNQREIARIQGDLTNLRARRAQAQTALESTERDLAAPDLPDGRKRTLERQRDQRKQDLDRLDQSIQTAEKSLQPAPQRPVDERFLKPYLLESVKIPVDPYVTVLCTNFSEYVRRFGFFSADDANTPGKALFPGHRALTHAVYGFFKNGGTRCFVARVKSDNAAEIDRALSAMESIDAIAIIAAPGLDGQVIWDKLVSHCEKCEDRFAILDCPADVETSGDLDVKLLSY